MNRMIPPLGKWMGLWLGVLGVSASANADIGVSYVDPSQAAFEQKMDSAENADRIKELRAMFDAGVAPTKEEIEGWWSGRHYQNSQNGLSLAILLAAEKQKKCVDEGPLFPCDLTLRLSTIVTTYHYPANHFDEMTPELKRTLQDMVDKAFSRLTDAVVQEGSLVSSYSDGNLEFRVRRALASKPNAPLYLVQAHLLRDQVNYGKKGDLYSVGYLFKKVK